MNIQQIIKEANNASFTPSQRAFDLAARTFVHQPPTAKQPKLGAVRRHPPSSRPQGRRSAHTRCGRYKRHKERLARGVKPGFGKGYSAPEVIFRVEFAWCDENGEEDEWQIHWVRCRKFSGEEYQFLKQYFEKIKHSWNKGESVESELVLRYIAHWLILNKDEQHLNMAFVFPSPKEGNETIRDPLYEIRWNSQLAGYKLDTDMAVMLKKCIWHKWQNEKKIARKMRSRRRNE